MITIQTLANNAVAVKNGDEITLFSYETPIVTIERVDYTYNIVKVYEAWTHSVTTSKHLNLFLKRHKLSEIAKLTRDKKEKYFMENNLLDN